MVSFVSISGCKEKDFQVLASFHFEIKVKKNICMVIRRKFKFQSWDLSEANIEISFLKS